MATSCTSLSSDELRAGARAAIERSLRRRRRAAAAFVAAGLGSVLFAHPSAGQEPDATPTSETTPPVDPYDDTTTVTEVAGDETTTTAVADEATPPTTAGDAAFRTVEVPRRRVTGDGNRVGPRAGGDGHRATRAQRAGGVHAATYSTTDLQDGDGVFWEVVTEATSTATAAGEAAVADVSVYSTYVTTIVSGSGSTATSYQTTYTNTIIDDLADGAHGVCIDPGADDAAGTCLDPSADVVPQAALDAVMYRAGTGFDEICSDRELEFGTQTIGDLEVSRRTFVPDDDAFVRHLTFVTNTGGTTETVGIDHASVPEASNTQIDSESGDADIEDGEAWEVAEVSDDNEDFAYWGQVFQGTDEVRSPMQDMAVDGQGSPTDWSYVVDIGPGETVGIATFQTLRLDAEDAGTKAVSIAAQSNSNQWDCLTADEVASIANFNPAEPEIAFAVTSVTVNEGAGTVTIQLARVGGGSAATSVQLTTSNGTATAGQDYTAVSQVVQFAEGEDTKSVEIPITQDSAVEGDETFTVTLSEVQIEAVTEPDSVVVTIQDDDTAATTTATTLATTTTARVGGTALPRTGGEIDGILQLAGGSVAAGAAAVYASERVRLRRWRHLARRGKG